MMPILASQFFNPDGTLTPLAQKYQGGGGGLFGAINGLSSPLYGPMTRETMWSNKHGNVNQKVALALLAAAGAYGAAGGYGAAGAGGGAGGAASTAPAG